jgi:hypothetical protein
MPRTREVREAIAWIERTGLAPELEALLRPTRRGRPRQLTVRALLIGIKLAIDSSKTSCLNDVHALLTEELSPHDQHELGVRDMRTGQTVSLFQVRRLFSRLADKLDPSSNASPSQSDIEPRVAAATLQMVLDRLVGATMPPQIQHGGAYAIDGTGVWSWSRGKRRGQASADPDARWGSKTAKKGGQEPYFGYELHALVRVSNLNQDPDTAPCLAERIIVSPAATNSVTAVLPTLRRLEAEGRRLREVVADRGYSYKTNWTLELFALGIDPVLDLHPTQYGSRGSHQGARIITGVPHCPATPDSFNTIQRPERLAESSALDQFITDISRREQWAFRRVNGPDQTGKERYECPARAGKIRCPLHKTTMTGPLALPKVIQPPPDPPTCCTQRTITVAGGIDTKSRQRHYWGSRDWIKAFSRRSRVEGWFGNLKNDSTEALNRGAFRVMGLAKTSLMLGVYAAATNLRLLRSWTRRHDTETTPRPEPAPRNRGASPRAATRNNTTDTSPQPPY